MTNFTVTNRQIALLSGPLDPSNIEDTLNQLVTALNNINGVQAPSTVTASTLTLSAAAYSGKPIVQNAAAGCTVTLPAAIGSGAVFTIYVGTTITSNGLIVNTAGSDVFSGGILVMKGSDGTSLAETSTANKTITYNGTTTGGIAGSFIRLVDTKSGQWQVSGNACGSGSIATPFSN